MISLGQISSVLLAGCTLSGIFGNATSLASSPQTRVAFVQIHGGLFQPEAFDSRRDEYGMLAFGASYGTMISPRWSVAGRLVYSTLRRTDYTIPASWGESYVKASREHQWILEGKMEFALPLGQSGIFAASGGLTCTLRHYTYEMTMGPDTYERSPALWGPVVGITLESPLGMKEQSPLSLVVDAEYSVAYGYDRGDLGNHGGFMISLGLGYSFGAQALE